MAEQIVAIPASKLQALVNIAKKHNKPIMIDWVNRTMEILSDEITNDKYIMSDGKPMKYRLALGRLRY